MANGYEDTIRAEWEKFSSEQGKLIPNIMLLGAAACGKSSLINLIFSKERGPVIDASHMTTGFETYYGREYNMNVNLIDSRGYEWSDGGGRYLASVKEKMKENLGKDPLEKIHVIWYCISVAPHKIWSLDIDIPKMLRENPELKNHIAVVITQCDIDHANGTTAKEYRKFLKKAIGEDLKVFEVSTDPKTPLELEALIVWSMGAMSDIDLEGVFADRQIKTLNDKRKAATVNIGVYTALAGSAAAILPYGRSAALIPLQLKMANSIIQIYEIEDLANISQAVIGNTLISYLGKGAASKLLKVIPGIPTRKIIHGGVASLITGTLGLAVSEICYNTCEKIAKGEPVDTEHMFDAEIITQYMDIFYDRFKSKGRSKNKGKDNGKSKGKSTGKGKQGKALRLSIHFKK